MGILCDKFDITDVILLSSLISAVSVLLFWGLCPIHGAVLLALFSITYGFFAGGFSSTWSGVLNEVKRANPGLETGLVLNLFAGDVVLGMLLVDRWVTEGAIRRIMEH
ncbi:hypothetical protein TSTA_013050 [Talaromyces stipitatus ATCC 10500]|uniref:Uncharacterized protein n=1 Tax=Talaromyces stipitatus (strain ATCC 10500 / CBS 375.48 / QM 6759 / NRRL 1006) TaxID=441959 RepID=B8MFA0_TALSN|nr:uncharacterized protein TSTA_013050 [Talaromyces stipitatus ATCC 10500]EED16199.1 hypothetical protein TSTA_013050 [Talaromyces stipitatus ATCC 10500]